MEIHIEAVSYTHLDVYKRQASYLILREGENDCVYQFRAKTLRVISQEPVDWSLDGEYGGSRTEILIENKSRAVSIRRRASSVVEALWKTERKA